MLKLLKTFSKKFKVCSQITIYLLTVFIFLGCSLFQSQPTVEVEKTYELDEAKKFIVLGEYEKAEKFLLVARLKIDTEQDDQKRIDILLHLAKVYDQMSLPEKAILNLQEALQLSSLSRLDYIKTQSMLLKNLAKVKVPLDNFENTQRRQFLTRVVQSQSSKKDSLEALRWSLDFNCDQYCVQEIQFLSEIQVQFYYVIEMDSEQYQRAYDVLVSRYTFFEGFLDDTKLDLAYRKKIAMTLFDCIQKAKNLHLENQTSGALQTGQIVIQLESLQKKIELWLYEKGA